MTEPSQYFKGRTVQEQMDEVIGYVDVRSAEVATAAIASDVAQVHQDMLDADADASAAAASAAAAAGTLANAVKKTGEASQSIAGDIAVAGTLSGGVVTGTQVTVPTPVNNTDAATKKYVDDADALDVHLAGNEAITGIKTAPLEATGTFSDQLATSNKLKNELDNYAPMVRLSDYQIIPSVKIFEGVPGACNARNPNIDVTDPPSSDVIVGQFVCLDKNNVEIAKIIGVIGNGGQAYMNAIIRNRDGTLKVVRLVTGD